MILVYGHPRSGTTALGYFLGEMFTEPSNEVMLSIDNSELRKLVYNSDINSRIFFLKNNDYEVIKEVSYGFNLDDLKTYIRNDHIKHAICIIRNDIFACVLSTLISYQIKKWHGDGDFIRNAEIGPLSVNHFKYEIEELKRVNHEILSLLSPKVKVVIYEDLFSVSPNQKQRWIDLANHCGLKFDENRWQTINQKRYNSIETYEKVPNISELRKAYMEYIYANPSNI